MSARHSAIVEAVRDMEAAAPDGALLAVGATSRSLARRLGVTETTALRYLKETIAAGQLAEIGHVGRKLLFPWPDGLPNTPERWTTGEVKRGAFRITTYREVGPAMAKIRFVFTPERLKLLMDQAIAEDAAEAAKKARKDQERQEKWAAEDAEGRAVFAKHYPALAGLLERFEEQVREEREGRSLGVRFDAREHPKAGVLGRVNIEVTDEKFAVLEAILRDGLGAQPEAGLEGVQE